MAQLDDIRVYSKRRVFYAFLGLVMLAFFARLIQLQLIYGDWYGRKSEENSVRATPREPVRGLIFDRHGTLVIDNRPAFTLTLMPYEFDRSTIPALAKLLGMEEDFISDRLRKGEQYSRFVPVKIRRNIDPFTVATLEEHRDKFPGVELEVESKRFYATKASAAHLLGYTREISEAQIKALGDDYAPGDVAGASGIEAMYENSLRGVKGSEFTTVNARGQAIGRYENGKNDIPAIEGNNLILTVDIGLQAFAESLMTGKRGAIVAVDPEDGGILAMVSKPDYDLSLLSGITSPELWRSLNQDNEAPLFNRATLTRYPPGSTFKMLLAIAALESGTITPSWRVTCTGAFRFGTKVFKDLHVHGSVDLVAAIQRSCNVYFYQLMLKTGIDTWSRYGAEFGFGQLTGIDMYEENSGILPTTDYMNRRYGANGWTKGFLVSLGIGQGEVGVTPLQMAMYAVALGTEGDYPQPHLVRAILMKSPPAIDTLTFPSRHIDVSQNTWNVVREGMRRVVEEPGGTGGMARIRGIVSAGKTGTAQNPHGPDHAWFVGFAPFDHPRIAIAVLVENAGFGGTAAAPIAGLCMERYLFGRLIRNDLPQTPTAVRSTAVVNVTAEKR